MRISNKIGLGFIAFFITALELSVLTTYTSFYTNETGIIVWSAVMGIGVGLAADLGY